MQAQFEEQNTLQEVLDLAVSKYKIVGIAASGFTQFSTATAAQVDTNMKRKLIVLYIFDISFR